MRKAIGKKAYLNNICSYILGLIIVQNTIYAFKISNTYINISYLFSVIIIGILMFINPKYVLKGIKKFDKHLILFFCAIPISVIPWLYITSTNPDIKSTSYIAGIISILLGISIYVFVLIYEKYIKSLVKGLWHGVILNVIICLVQYISFNNNSVFSLAGIFPQHAFYISIPWGIAPHEIGYKWFIYYYRAQGLFLECSHFIASITSIIFIIFVMKRESALKKIIFILLTFFIAISGSANLIIYICAWILYYALYKIKIRNNKREAKRVRGLKKKTWVTLYIGIFLISILICTPFGQQQLKKIKNIESSIVTSFTTVNLADESNEERFTFMMKALKLVPNYPLGLGYNMASSALRVLANTYSSFNYFITITLELGFIGVALYILFMCSLIFSILKNAKSKYSIAIVVELVVISIFQFANGIDLIPLFMLVFALGTIEKSNLLRKTLVLKEDFNKNINFD